jgi:DNA-binding CsgD family transcriptional regulator
VRPALPIPPVALAPPCLEISFCESDRQLHPSTLKGDPRFVECFSDPAPMLARIDTGIETARPTPLRRRVGHACAPADDADPDVAEMDQPRKVSMTASYPTEAAARQFRLTPSEARVLDAVLKVSGVSEIAEALGISEATVKTHLQNIFGKTGVRRQADLIKLVAADARPFPG